MSVELITFNDALCIKDETVHNLSGNSLVNYFISIAVLAETAISNSDSFPWLIEPKLAQRRNAYEFDKNLQINETDRHIGDKKPKFKNTGKRGLGKTDWR